MADSNLDFGQGWYALERYLKDHPDVQIVTTEPKEGKFVIGVNDYLDLNEEHKYSWIYKLKPAAQINHCFLLFNNNSVEDKNARQ
jgi:hypothetical protein